MYTWYEVEKNIFIANVEDRVVFIPKNETDVIDLQKKITELEETVETLRAALNEIKKISNTIVQYIMKEKLMTALAVVAVITSITLSIANAIKREKRRYENTHKHY